MEAKTANNKYIFILDKYIYVSAIKCKNNNRTTFYS